MTSKIQRRQRSPKCARKSRLDSWFRPWLLSLEDRTLPSTIVWANRGTGPGVGDTDGFNAAYGDNADKARDVIEAARMSWERVISNFNNGTNTITIDFYGGASVGPGAKASHDRNNNSTIESTEVNAQGYPLAGRIDLGTGPYFFDPTPLDNSEFMGNIFNAYAGVAPPSSDAFGKNDLYTVAVVEMTHIMGISTTNFTATGETLRLQQDPNGYLSDTGVEVRP